MGKNVYSLVLMDEVVNKIDEEAYLRGTSRSNLINQILAEAVSYKTPQKEFEDIFMSLTDMFNSLNNFQILSNPSPSLINIKSSLKYKYRPTIKYSVELYHNNEYSFGKLKVSLRTKNEALITDINNYYKLWAALEEEYIKKILDNKLLYKIDNDRYERQFIMPKHMNKKIDLGEEIGNYINVFDKLLKVYIENLPLYEEGYKNVNEEYIKLMNGTNIII